jgi:HD-GYP domain-containing protein (c-di-GMP phosphodiesterase class II)
MMQMSDVDLELLEDFITDLHEQGAPIEQALAVLQQAPANSDQYQGLFRAFHNLKGAAGMCRFEPGVEVAHRIETLLSRVQSGELTLSPILGETLLLATDRLEQAAGALLDRQPIGQLQLERLVQGLDELIAVPAMRADAVAAQVIEAVSGFRPRPIESGEEQRAQALSDSLSDDPIADLTLFRSLALQLERRSSHFQGRTGRLRQLALAMNIAAGKLVDPLQLEAAIYMHDVGMMFLPEPLWLKPGRLNDEEWAQMRLHPGFAADLLARMKGWGEARRIVAQHHEKPDGTGYPEGLKGDAICPGAKILSIVDAFEAVMLKHSYRGQNVSMLRAASEINGCDNQFAAEWIGPFNRIVKKML